MTDNYLNQFLIAKKVQINSKKQTVFYKSKNTISIGGTDIDISEILVSTHQVSSNFENYLSQATKTSPNPSKQNIQRINIKSNNKMRTTKKVAKNTRITVTNIKNLSEFDYIYYQKFNIKWVEYYSTVKDKCQNNLSYLCLQFALCLDKEKKFIILREDRTSFAVIYENSKVSILRKYGLIAEIVVTGQENLILVGDHAIGSVSERIKRTS